MGQEIEKKFLLSGRPENLGTEIKLDTEIKQGYLSTGDPEVMVRQEGYSRLRFFVTVKTDKGFVRGHQEAEVSREAFDVLWPATEGARIEKMRFKLAGPDGLVWEIDQFYGALRGLFLAELELDSPKTKFSIPPALAPFIVRDVTDDEAYKNKNLATKGWPKD